MKISKGIENLKSLVKYKVPIMILGVICVIYLSTSINSNASPSPNVDMEKQTVYVVRQTTVNMTSTNVATEEVNLIFNNLNFTSNQGTFIVDKMYIIEMVSMEAIFHDSQQQSMIFIINVSSPKGKYFFVANLAGNWPDGNHYVVSQQTKIYVNPGARVDFFATRSSPYGDGEISGTNSGYFSN